MDEVRQKVLLDLFASPLTLLPVVGGLTALLASWAMGGNAPLAFAGFVGILGGIGMFATRMVFGLEQLTRRAYDYALEQRQKNQQSMLLELDRKLQKDHDPRTQTLLRQLWHLYQGLQKDIQEGKITVAAHHVLESVDQMFAVCIRHLRESYDLWKRSERISGQARQNTLTQREELIHEVQQSVEHLEQTLDKLRTVATRRNKSELARLRAELDETIEVARRTEKRTEILGTEADYDSAEFE
jgi:hypothetical protein